MRIVTYNVNSVRIRLEIIRRLVEEARPDILCLQETKVEDGLFPEPALRALGFGHIRHSGQKSYNGMAILSRLPLEEETRFDFIDPAHKRHLGVTLPGGVALHNFYVPAGGDVPDRTLNPKFDFKLRFLAAMAAWAKRARPDRQDRDKRMILLGDLNIAPLEQDVWSHRQLLGVVSHTPVEVEALNHLQETLAWVDAPRRFVPQEEKLYSWWSYRGRDWLRSDRGRRLDHLWITPDLLPRLASAHILKEARGWENPSDHVPVIADLDM
jgi:exodeoxyribonuclease-3